MSRYFSAGVYERVFGFRPVARFRRFLETERAEFDGKQAELPTYGDPMEVWFGGSALESFINDDWPDTDEDGKPYGHPSATEIDFEDEALEGWVPLATIGDEESQILLCKASKSDCPVAMWEDETNELVAVASELDDFLGGLE